MWVNTKHTHANRVNPTGRRSEPWCGPKTASESQKAALIMACILKTLISPLLLYFKERLFHSKKRKMNLDGNKKLKGESWEAACGRVLLFLAAFLQSQKLSFKL